jgi:hypothetical protein
LVVAIAVEVLHEGVEELIIEMHSDLCLVNI